MAMTSMSRAATLLGVPRQALHYFYLRGQVSGVDTGTVVLVDVEQAQRELEAVGFYRRRETLRRNKQLREAEAVS